MWPKLYMDEGGGPDLAPADPGTDQGSESPPVDSPDSTEGFKGRDDIEFPIPVEMEEERGETKETEPFYKVGDKAFATRQDLDTYMGEQSSQQAGSGPDAMEARFAQMQSQISDSLANRFDARMDQLQRQFTPQQQEVIEERVAEVNPHDPDTEPAEWIKFQEKALRQEMGTALDSMQQAHEEQMQSITGEMAGMKRSDAQRELAGNYEARFSDVAKELGIDKEWYDDIEELVARNPDTRDDLTNVREQASMYWGRMKSKIDRLQANKIETMRKRAEPHRASIHRGSSAPIVRRTSQAASPEDRKAAASLDGRNSTFNKISRSMARQHSEQ